VALVAGERVSKAALSDFLHDRFRETWARGLDLLIDERLSAAEARRLGVTVPPAALERAVAAEVAAREEAARQDGGAGLEETVRRAYGLDPATWRATVLRPRVERHLLLERVVRRSGRARDQVVVRVLVVRDPARARALVGRLAAGADFGLLALQESEDPSKAQGGLLPPIVRGDLARKDLEAALFASAPGAVVGPFEVSGPRGTEWHLYRVVERLPPWGADPAVANRLLEEDLVKNPVGRSEYERWAARARRDAGVRYFAPDGSPLRLPE
jgi:parvulin-like peptidyl-prolyl isomerase